jgi:hypothetical protein
MHKLHEGLPRVAVIGQCQHGLSDVAIQPVAGEMLEQLVFAAVAAVERADAHPGPRGY